jgi:SAM-dependent methyltransferase
MDPGGAFLRALRTSTSGARVATAMLFEVRGVLQNLLLGVGPVRRSLHRRLGRTGMNGDPNAAQARLDSYLRDISIDGKSVLELGPGHTPEVLMLARKQGAARCVGLDIEHLIEPKGVRERGVELDLYDGRRMPYADGTFDVVWSSDVLEHVPDAKQTIGECYRVLRPGGRCAAIIDLRDHYFLHIEEKWFHCLKYSDVLWRVMTSNRSSFVNRLRSSEWESLLEKTGFVVRRYEKEQSEVLRRLHREGRIPRHDGPMTEDDASTYRLVIVVEKPAAAS